MPNVPYPYEVNWQLVTGNGSLTPICSLSNRSLSPSLYLGNFGGTPALPTTYNPTPLSFKQGYTQRWFQIADKLIGLFSKNLTVGLWIYFKQ